MIRTSPDSARVARTHPSPFLSLLSSSLSRVDTEHRSILRTNAANNPLGRALLDRLLQLKRVSTLSPSQLEIPYPQMPIWRFGPSRGLLREARNKHAHCSQPGQADSNLRVESVQLSFSNQPCSANCQTLPRRQERIEKGGQASRRSDCPGGDPNHYPGPIVVVVPHRRIRCRDERCRAAAASGGPLAMMRHDAMAGVRSIGICT